MPVLFSCNDLANAMLTKSIEIKLATLRQDQSEEDYALISWSTVYGEIVHRLLFAKDVPFVFPPFLHISDKLADSRDSNYQVAAFNYSFNYVKRIPIPISHGINVNEKNFIKNLRQSYGEYVPYAALITEMISVLLHELGHFYFMYEKWKVFCTENNIENDKYFEDWLNTGYHDMAIEEIRNIKWTAKLLPKIMLGENHVYNRLGMKFGGPFQEYLATRDDYAERGAYLDALELEFGSSSGYGSIRPISKERTLTLVKRLTQCAKKDNFKYKLVV